MWAKRVMLMCVRVPWQVTALFWQGGRGPEAMPVWRVSLTRASRLKMRDEDTVRLFAAAEERLLNAHKQKMPVPVLLLSGSLGAGKTTLLNHLLSNKLNLRITAIVNDLSALNIDADMLITGRTERTFKLSNGCACHSLSGELEEGLWQTLQETDGTDRVDYVVIEMSGAASDPSRVVESLARRYGKMTRAHLENRLGRN